MRKQDIKTDGTVYGFHESRSSDYARPVVVLSTEHFARTAHSGRLRLTSKRLGKGSWSEDSVGLAAVTLIHSPADAAAVLDSASVEDFAEHGRVLDKDGNEIGQYQLITSLAYLHGEYAELQEQWELSRRHDAEVRARREAEQEQRLVARDALARRLDQLGVKMGQTSYLGSAIMLSFEEADKLISLAEREVKDVT